MNTMMNSSRDPRRNRRQSGERGYAMLMALSMTMMILIASTAMIANLRIEGKRQREDEAIWRGNQYARAIRMYFRKTGHYPQTLQDLQKGLPQLHFLRQAYKDPLNKSDGSWRFIYVNAAGQIIGSTKYTSLQQMALYDSGALQNGLPGQIPGLVGTPVSSLTNSSGFGDVNGNALSNPSNSAQNPSLAPTDPNAPPQAPGQPPSQSLDQSGQNPPGSQPPTPPPGQPSAFGQPGAPGQPGTAPGQSPFGSLNGQVGNPADLQKPTGPVDGPVLGAFLTGVASKVDAPSQKVYHHGKKYIQWEFVWNPLEEAAANMQQSLNPQGQQPGIGQPIGQGGIGGIGSPTSNPFGQPSAPQPQPQQSQQQ
jgi:type II secretory pathway pseudopilin PulG